MPDPGPSDWTERPLPSDFDRDSVIVATYRWRLAAGVDIESAAAGVAQLQSVGSGFAERAAASPGVRRHLAWVVDAWQADDAQPPAAEPSAREWLFRIAYPAHNVGGQIPLLLTAVFGECASIPGLRLLDIQLPPSFLGALSGPAFGISGVRELVGVPERPLVVAMIKPSLGLTPRESAEVFYQAAVGGADAVKDDELAVSHPWSTFRERAREHARAAASAFEETGRRTLYFANITDRPDRIVANAHQAIDAGATGLMVAVVPVGVAALSALVEDQSIDVPILGHLAQAGAMTAGPQGMSPHLVLGRLPRLAGADLVVYPSPYGPLEMTRSDHVRLAAALTDPLGTARPALPVPGGGCNAAVVRRLVEDLGRDFAIGVGGAIHRHPMGIVAGTRAIRQAIDAAVAGEPVERAAHAHPELAAALVP